MGYNYDIRIEQIERLGAEKENAERSLVIAKERIEKLEAEKGVMLEALESMNYLINNSTGVVGWHLNGDIEPWEHTEVAQEISDAIAVAKESSDVRDEIIRKARSES